MTLSLAPLFAGLGLGFSLIVAIGAQNVFVLRQGIRREHVLAVVILCAVSDAVLIAVGISGIGVVLEQLPWLLPAARWAGALFLIGYGVLAARRALRPGSTGLQAELGDVDTSSDAHASLNVDAKSSDDARTGEEQLAAAAAQATRVGSRAVPPTATATPPSRAAASAGPSSSAATPSAVATGARATTLAAALATAFALTWLNPHVYLDTVFLLGSVANGYGEQARWLFGAGAIVASIVWFTSLGFGARYLGRWLATARAWRILDGVIAVVMVVLGVLLVLPH